jgi:hypothetical protein
MIDEPRGGLLALIPVGASDLFGGQRFAGDGGGDDLVDLGADHGPTNEQFFRERAHDMLARSQQRCGLIFPRKNGQG